MRRKIFKVLLFPTNLIMVLFFSLFALYSYLTSLMTLGVDKTHRKFHILSDGFKEMGDKIKNDTLS